MLVRHFKIVDVWLGRTLGSWRSTSRWLGIAVHLCAVFGGLCGRPEITDTFLSLFYKCRDDG